MSTPIAAVYQNGVFRPTVPPDLPDGTAVRLTVEPVIPAAAPNDRTAKVVIDRTGVAAAFAFDRHFRQFGTLVVMP